MNYCMSVSRYVMRMLMFNKKNTTSTLRFLFAEELENKWGPGT